jgi:F-type H+-transporting ATPase subunit alpha
VQAQVMVLLTLTEKLFDDIPLDQMKLAEESIGEAALNISAEVCARFATANKLSQDDRSLMLDLAKQALSKFKVAPDVTPKKNE